MGPTNSKESDEKLLDRLARRTKVQLGDSWEYTSLPTLCFTNELTTTDSVVGRLDAMLVKDL